MKTEPALTRAEFQNLRGEYGDELANALIQLRFGYTEDARVKAAAFILIDVVRDGDN